ncbi:MAG: peptidoglycan DD-metalloendopeptidase family protein [Bacteroidales bacterium]|nr:peptidoglycan DD-metalloendopeptidase family protein [Bacteroidales bacterium]
MSKKIFSFLILTMALLCSCNHQEKAEEPVIEEDNHVYMYGIPIDLFFEESGQVGRGDYFSTILDRYGVPQKTAYELAEISKSVFDVKNIQVGRSYHAYFEETDTSRTLAYLVYENSQQSVVRYTLKDTLAVTRFDKEMLNTLKYAEVEINTSLWNDIIDAGQSPLLAIKLSDIYAWAIDFFALQKGDKFCALYDEIGFDGKVMDIGNVYYSTFNHANTEYKCFYFDEGEGGNNYWNENGESMRKAFLKAPLSYTRISSGFTYARRHPITRKVQPHTGVDYAAPKGTPVVTIGDGVVTSAKNEGAGGLTVRIKHNSVYKTAYLHLSRFGQGIKAGARVTQGQVIGYVGSTGQSTGPHLDFRVWKNDSPINPLTMESPPANPVKDEDREAFEQAKADALAMRDKMMVGEYYKKIVLDPLSVSGAF